MLKTWTRVRHERTFEFGRDVFVQVLLALFFGSTGALTLIVITLRAPSNPIYLLLTPIIYLMARYAGRAYLRARFAVTEWRRWREFLKELDGIKTFDTTFTTHDL